MLPLLVMGRLSIVADDDIALEGDDGDDDDDSKSRD